MKTKKMCFAQQIHSYTIVGFNLCVSGVLKNISVRQFGCVQYNQSAELLNVVWVSSTDLGELIAPYSFEVFDFNFALDPETLQVISVHPSAMHFIFETNPFAAQHWAEEY